MKNFQRAAKDDRAGRALQLTEKERYVIEMAAFYLDVDESIIEECAIDSTENIRVLTSLFEPGGAFKILIQYQPDDPPSMGNFDCDSKSAFSLKTSSSESGRYDPKLKHQKIPMALFSDGPGRKIIGKAVAVSRSENKTFFKQNSNFEQVSDDLSNWQPRLTFISGL